ncbi:cob(I)yrinic acid a,c-diamide adenosyltransferase [Amphritea sp. HPY]|uniref:cob(I)yrinic acid a,c-diamide adenosyltransferase n=1 Tax=Amphritea sp. HPY TaxID=3421652 RepID=UPI003D7C5FA3
MSDRLTRIYTRTGDSGTTSLANGRRVIKSHPRMEAIGTVDELNCSLGTILAEPSHDTGLTSGLRQRQNDLFDLGGELSINDVNYRVITKEMISEMEYQLDQTNALLPTLKNFILPGGNRQSALCHQSRAICRRAERRLIELNEIEPINPQSLIYINRLSDLLFVYARSFTQQYGNDEIMWQPKNNQ